MQNQGEQLKAAIRQKGLTQQDAADKLGMSRQNLGLYFSRPVLPRQILHDAKVILGIDLQNEGTTTDDETEQDKEKELLYELKEALRENTLMVDYRKDLLARLIRLEANQEVMGQRIDQVLSILLKLDLEKVLRASENEIKLTRQDLLDQLESGNRKK